MNKVDLLGSQTQGVVEILSDELPFDVCKLPSKGLLYPSNHPLHKKEFVEFKAMTTHEENILSTTALLKQGLVLNVLMKSCLCDKSIDPSSLLIGDKSALLLAIRISGYGPEYRTQTTCPNCNENFIYNFDLGSCEIKNLQINPVNEGENLFEYFLSKSKKRIKFSLPTDADDLEVLKIQENRKKAIKNSQIDTTVSDRLTLAIKEIDGKTDREYISNFIRRMPAFDAKNLRAYINKVEPDMLMKEAVTCKFCSVKTEHIIPMGYNFFWPQIED